jgi:hypothetical protein
MKKTLEIILDFDATVVTHDFPNIGKDIGAVPVLKQLVEKGHKLILFTMRSHRPFINFDGTTRDCLQEAIDWFKDNDIPLYGINTNPTQKDWTDSPKAYGQLSIDDIGFGIPLKVDKNLSPRPFVDWFYVEIMLKQNEII